MAYSVDFRRKQLNVIYDSIASGDSAMVIGVGSVGKTHFIRHFTRNDRIQNYWLARNEMSVNDILYVPIDPNGFILEPSSEDVHVTTQAWIGFELILRSLYRAVELHFEDADDLLTLFKITYDSIFQQNNQEDLRIFPRLLRMVKFVLDRLGENGRIVFVIDEMERFVALPTNLFLNLRHMRDLYRSHTNYHIVFIGVARQDLQSFIPKERHHEFEPFMELFQNQTYLNQVESEVEFDEIFDGLVSRIFPNDFVVSRDVRENLYHITGGHGGLLRASLLYLKQVGANDNVDEVKRILRQSMSMEECHRMLESLSQSEHSILAMIVDDSYDVPNLENDMIINKLIAKSILRQDENGQLDIVPLLFKQYLMNTYDLWADGK